VTTPSEVTLFLQEAAAGSSKAADRLLPLVYGELRALAQRQLGRESAGHTLQATALVHEAYLRLIDQTKARFQDRNHFFAVAATAMRRILIDHARTRGRAKRGGGAVRVELDAAADAAAASGIDLIALDDAMVKLEAVDPRKARLVELRYFGGLTIEETAALLDISLATAKREWLVAKGFLYREMTGESAPHE
jgi:RNA polymerase sigma factor (TIGR02999 family)